MSTADVCVQRLRLVAGGGASGHALRARVEDALRISSKPAALAHRFVLVRRLRLMLPREASAQSLALQLEREWRTLEALAEPIERAAPAANAVWAVDEVRARLLLLQRWLHGGDSEAWFWQRLLPAAAASMPLPQRLAALLFQPLEHAHEPEASMRSQQERLWRHALPQIDEAELLPGLLAVLAAPQRALLRAAAPACFEALQAAANETTAAMSPLRAAVPADIAIEPPLRPAPAQRGEPGAVVASPSDGGAAAAAAPGTPPLAGDAGPIARGDGLSMSPGASDEGAAARPSSTPAASSPSACASADAAVTDWAGLWFLLPLLQQQRLGQQHQAARLFAAILRLAEIRHGLDAAARQWVLHVAQHAGPADDSPLPQAPKALQATAEAWWRQARMACLRQTRLPLRRLLHRPGRVWLSPHRIDLLLPLARADIRIRRAGFDIDPGYVPWLDCVIRFHYQ